MGEHTITFTGRIYSRYVLDPTNHYVIAMSINENELRVPPRCGVFVRPVAPDIEVLTERSDSYFDVNIGSLDEATLSIKITKQSLK